MRASDIFWEGVFKCAGAHNKWKEELQIDTSAKSPKYKDTVGLGRSKKNGKWYGWSHRAYHGFAPGDVVKKGDVICGTQSDGSPQEFPNERGGGYFPEGYKIKDDADAERAAACFAEAVS